MSSLILQNQTYLWAVTRVSMNFNPSNLGANLSDDGCTVLGVEELSSFFFQLLSWLREIRTFDEDVELLVEIEAAATNDKNIADFFFILFG